MFGNRTCEQLVFERSGSINVFTFCIGMIQLVVFLAIVIYQIIAKRRAKLYTSARSNNLTMFPAYMRILWMFGVSLVLFAIGNISFSTRPHVSSYSIEEGIYWGFVNWQYHTVIDGILIFLCFRGAGTVSYWQSLLISTALGFLSGVGSGLAFLSGHWAPDRNLDYGLGIQLSVESLLFVIYITVLLSPSHWFYRRPAAYFYAGCWTIYRPIYISLLVLMYLKIDESFCVYAFVIIFFWSMLKPVLIYKTLQQDQRYWLGAIIDDRSRQGSQSKISRNGVCDMDDYGESSPLLQLMHGDQLDIESASALGCYVDVMCARCPMIDMVNLKFEKLDKNFDSQELLKQRLLGAGGTGRVYRGLYQEKTVAIKMLYCIHLEQETIRNFCLENSLLSTIRHPNVVQVEGVCVNPPALASVMELCDGSCVANVLWIWDQLT